MLHPPESVTSHPLIAMHLEIVHGDARSFEQIIGWTKPGRGHFIQRGGLRTDISHFVDTDLALILSTSLLRNLTIFQLLRWNRTPLSIIMRRIVHGILSAHSYFLDDKSSVIALFPMGSRACSTARCPNPDPTSTALHLNYARGCGLEAVAMKTGQDRFCS